MLATRLQHRNRNTSRHTPDQLFYLLNEQTFPSSNPRRHFPGPILVVHLWGLTYGPAYGHRPMDATPARGCDSRIFLREYYYNIDTE